MADIVRIQSEHEQMIPASQVMDALTGMAMLLRNTNERMAALEMEVKRLTKVTPAQANDINDRMRKRAMELCRQHRIQGSEKAVTAAIRKDVKRLMGIGTARELPRGDYQETLKLIEGWDDFDVILRLKKEARRNG